MPFDAGGWDSDPLRLTERDGRLYGLGSTDMKGFFAIALEAASAFDPKDFKAPLYLLATADEERDARSALAAQGPSSTRACRCGGRAYRLATHANAQGHYDARRQVAWQSGHSSDPSLGNNVIDALPTLLSVLSNYRDELATKFRCELMAVPVPTINFGCVHGAIAPTVFVANSILVSTCACCPVSNIRMWSEI